MEEKNLEKDMTVEVEFDGGAIEVKPFDVTPYVGQKATIEEVTTKHNEKFNSYYLMVKTNIVAYVDEEKKNPVRASKLFALMSQDGKFGWRKDGDLDLFLKSVGATNPNELIGKEVLMISTKPNKDGAKFLTFN